MAQTSNSLTTDKVIEKGMKYFFLHATGLTIPYLGYKVIKKVMETPVEHSKTVGAVAAVAGIAALVGLEDEIDNIDA